MKNSICKYIVIGALLIAGCSSNTNEESQPFLMSSEIFGSNINNEESYGVHLRLMAEKTSYVQYAIELKVDERVWFDTLALELPAAEIVEAEVIFSESKKAKGDKVELILKGKEIVE